MQVPPDKREGEEDEDKGYDPRRSAEHGDGWGQARMGWDRCIHGIEEWTEGAEGSEKIIA